MRLIIEGTKEEALDLFRGLYKDTGIYIDYNNVPACCRNCSNHPSNGGSGICNCVLPYMTTTGYSITC